MKSGGFPDLAFRTIFGFSHMFAAMFGGSQPSRGKMILSLIQQAGVNRFNTFVREKLSASLRMVALTTLASKLGATAVEGQKVSRYSPPFSSEGNHE